MASEYIGIGAFTHSDGPQIAVMHIRHGATSPHTHDCYEIVLVKEGTCLHETNGRAVLLMAGDLFVIRPGDTHRYISNHDIALINCLFTESSLDGIAQRLRSTPGAARLFDSHADYLDRVHLDLPQRELINKMLAGMMETLQQRPAGWQLQICAELTLLLLQCVRLFSEVTHTEGDKRLYLGYVSKALQFIDAEYIRDLSIRDIAGHSGVSPDYFSRQFRQITGITPIEYLNRYRLARSMELLRKGQPVLASSALSGFRSLSHFSREFKRHIGQTPSQYRKQHQMDPASF